MSRFTTLTAPAGAVTQENNVFNALKNAAGDSFWLAAGGAIDVEDGTMDTFSTNSIVLRGGMIRCTFSNDNTVADPVRVRVWLIRNTKVFFNTGWIGTRVAGFDPTHAFNNPTDLGRILIYKEFLLENNNIGEVAYRLPMMEIRLADFVAGGQGFHWLTAVHAPGGNACGVSFVNSFNLSFVGDVV